MNVNLICFAVLLINSAMLSEAADRPNQSPQDELIKDRVSPEYSVVHNLGIFIEAYAQSHDGNLPTSWSQLDAFSSLTTFGNPPVQERYALVTNTTPSDELGDAQVIVIGNSPSTDAVEKGEGRLILYRTKDGGYAQGWFPETKVQKIIAQTHITVPPPVRPPTSNNPQPSTSSDNHEQEHGATPPQTALPESVSSTSVASSQTPKLPAYTAPVTDTGVPIWLYCIIVLSVGLIGVLWYRSRSKQ